MIKNFNNKFSSNASSNASSNTSTSSKPVCKAQGSSFKTHADLNNDMIDLYLSFLPPNEIAKIKRVSRSYYERANLALNHYQLIDKNCKKKTWA